MIEYEYQDEDGRTVKGVASYSYRSGPIGRWMAGSTPLDDLRAKYQVRTRPVGSVRMELLSSAALIRKIGE